MASMKRWRVLALDKTTRSVLADAGRFWTHERAWETAASLNAGLCGIPGWSASWPSAWFVFDSWGFQDPAISLWIEH